MRMEISVLRQIHAIRNWTNPQHAGLLPASDDMLCCLWFGKSIVGDEFTKKMQHSFNVCLTTNSVTDIKAEDKRSVSRMPLQWNGSCRFRVLNSVVAHKS